MDVKQITIDNLVINAAAPSVVDYLALGRLYLRHGFINEEGMASFSEFLGSLSSILDQEVEMMKQLSYKRSVVEGQKTPISDSTFAADPSALFAYMYEYMCVNFIQLVNRAKS